MKSELTERLDEAAEALHGADAVLITAGAGMGVDSGLPDFRGNKGFWKAYPPIARLGISFSGMANPSWFDTDPELAWAFYGHRLNLYRRTTPHRGFGQLLEMAVRKSGGYFVFTSNVDGQFQKAGYLDDRIEECHGSIHHLQCTAPCTDEIWDGSRMEVDVDEESFRALEPLPRCINCGRVARPNILMFGDLTWVSRRTDSQNQRLNSWLRKVREERLKLVIVEIGAGEAVPTVRMTSEHVARDHGGTLIRINPRDHHGPPGHIPVPLSSTDGIDRIYERVKEIRES
ncbi:MAG: Sir2 family NAD-dependent protein deacetylase [Candidatus Tritonobacter lacicola]|nr:Sir2 family NAD-dependent protein deacetylase [Candidatus Tritonobacter lacicola]